MINDNVRKMFIGLTPITHELDIDSSNTTQVKNFIALAEFGLKELKFKVLDSCFENGGDGSVELAINLNTLDFEKEELDASCEIVKKILTVEDPDYDDDTTFPDIVKRFYNMCSNSGALEKLNLSEYDDAKWRTLTKLIIMSADMGEDYVDHRDVTMQSTESPIFIIHAIEPELLDEVYEANVPHPLLYIGYAAYSAVLNTFANDYTQEELDEMSDIALQAIRIGDRTISTVPADSDIAEDIQEGLMNEYKGRFEIPEGTLLN